MKYFILVIILVGFLLFFIAFFPAWRSRAVGMAVILSVAFLVVAGIWPLSIGLRSTWRGLASAHWPTVPGVVLKTEMTEEESKDLRTSNVYTFYIAKLTFGYRVNGRDYTTQNLQFGRAVGSGDSSEATVLMMRYAPGTKVPIHYSPKDPTLATVRTGVNSDFVWYLVAGAVFILLGGAVALGYFAVIRWDKFATGLFCAIFALFGIALIVPGLQNLLHARASRGWPTAKAVVVYAAEEPGSQTLEASEGQIDPATGFVLKYQTAVNDAPMAYMYEVQGTKYFSTIRHFGQFAESSGNWADEILQRYPTGTEVPVSYCPTDPDLAVLEPGINSEVYGLLGGGAAFILFALMVLLWTILRR